MSQKQNKFLIGYGVGIAVVAGILGYLCLGASSTYDEKEQSLESKSKALEKLKAKPLFPNKDNVGKKKQQVVAFAAEVDKFHQAMLAYQKPLVSDITGDAVRTSIGKYKATLQALAKARGIELPANFDVGLDRYTNAAPVAAVAPQVNFVAESVNTLLTNIFRRGITKLDYVNAPEMSYEKPPAAPAADPKKSTTGTAAKPATTSGSQSTASKSKEVAPVLAEDKVFKRYHVYVSFSGSEKSVSEAINDIAAIGEGGPFFVINNLRLENEKLEGPQKGGDFQVTPVQPDPNAPPPPSGAEVKPANYDARYILGNEKVTAFLDLDLLRFEEVPPPPGSPTSVGATKPAATTPTPASANPTVK